MGLFDDSVVWLYLFLLPLQLVNDFVWHTVPAVRVLPPISIRPSILALASPHPSCEDD
jgi:predicted membrane chloride channel (bestrophin family)